LGRGIFAIDVNVYDIAVHVGTDVTAVLFDVSQQLRRSGLGSQPLTGFLRPVSAFAAYAPDDLIKPTDAPRCMSGNDTFLFSAAAIPVSTATQNAIDDR